MYVLEDDFREVISLGSQRKKISRTGANNEVLFNIYFTAFVFVCLTYFT